MPILSPDLFSQSVFGGSQPRPTTQKAAAAGFSAIFGSMLAGEMRESMVGEDAGPMGISGGASGDIYGSLLDDALGKTLAGSKSMSQLNSLIERGLSSPGQAERTAKKPVNLETSMFSGSQYRTPVALPDAPTIVDPVSLSYRDVSAASDARGPLLLPPAPVGPASDLQPPTPEE